MAPIAGRSRSRGGYEGAIAQLGERVVRNDEVGGSIPPGSTSLRSLRELRLGKPRRGLSQRSERRLPRRSPFGRRRALAKCYFPVNRGGRFSIKLATPSLKSL